MEAATTVSSAGKNSDANTMESFAAQARRDSLHAILSKILQLTLQTLHNLRLCMRFAQQHTTAAQKCRQQHHRNRRARRPSHIS
jgi:hypothetical protein